jgi:hypothetical protein
MKLFLLLVMSMLMFSCDDKPVTKDNDGEALRSGGEIEKQVVYKDMYGHDFITAEHDGYLMIEYKDGDNTIIWSVCADKDKAFTEVDMTRIVGDSKAPWVNEKVSISGNPHCISIVKREVDVAEFWSASQLRATKVVHKGKWLTQQELIAVIEGQKNTPPSVPTQE